MHMSPSSSGPTVTKGTTTTTRRRDAVGFVAKYGTIFTLGVLVVVFAAVSDRFLTPMNLINILRQMSMLAIAAAGLTICMACQEFDLSVGTLAGLVGVVTVKLITQGVPVVLAVAVGLGVGVVFGLVNGFVTAGVGISSMIVTLGTMSIASGAALTYTNGRAIYADLPASFWFWGAGYVWGMPTPIIVMAVVVFLAYMLLNRTKLGRHLYAIGGNRTAAALSGVDVRMTRIKAFIISGFLAALAGIILAARMGSGQPTAGGNYLLEGLGSVFLGMTTIRPGQPNIMGTVVGVLIMGVVANGLTLAGVSSYVQEMIKGAIMISAVVLAVLRGELKL